MSKDIFVVPFYGNWAVKQNGKDYPISTHNNKEEAIKIGFQLTKRLHSQLVILNAKGMIESK